MDTDTNTATDLINHSNPRIHHFGDKDIVKGLDKPGLSMEHKAKTTTARQRFSGMFET